MANIEFLAGKIRFLKVGTIAFSTGKLELLVGNIGFSVGKIRFLVHEIGFIVDKN